MTTSKFNAYLFEKAARFDEELLSTFDPLQDSWTGNVITAPGQQANSSWWIVRELTRRLSEGAAYTPTVSVLTPADWDKFERDIKESKQ